MKKFLIIILLIFTGTKCNDRAKKLAAANLQYNLNKRQYPPLTQKKSNIIGRKILMLTNRFRKNQGLPELKWDQNLFKIAQKHARQMANGTAPYSHANKEKRSAEYNSLTRKNAVMAENLFQGFSSKFPAVVTFKVFKNNKPVIKNGQNKTITKKINNIAQFTIEGWKESEKHRENLLRKEYKGKVFKAGAVGVARTPNGRWYMTQLLAAY